MKNLTDKLHHQASQRGFSLMEVLIGIAIFAIGMLALASLQGALTRSSAEAKVRTTAINIAERILEEQEGFAQIAGPTFSFMSIVDVGIAVDDPPAIVIDSTMTRNPAQPVGAVYTVTQDVTDYYYDLATDAFTTIQPAGLTIPDYKSVVVNVAWNDDRNYVIDEGNETTGNLGGGSVAVSTTISKMSTVNAVRVAEQDNSDIIAPDIVYEPGDNPDIIRLGLGDQKFKESLTPEPKIYRDNLETRFDVVTYSQANADAYFLRREEFVAVSCECTLNNASESNQGYSPAVWAGDEYTEPELKTKPYGTPIGNVAQSSLCGACCRDHHDSEGSALYDPSRPSEHYSDDGNHKHYYRQGGNLQVAAAGDDYVEACRFVRKDGFFRLTQDFRLEGLNTFAGDFLITAAEVDNYSAYVIGEVYNEVDPESYVKRAIALDDGYQLDADPPVVHSAPRGDTTNDLTLGYTTLPTSASATFQQLRSRSIYVDNLSSDLRGVIDCLEKKSLDEKIANPRLCDQGDVQLDQTTSTNILEIIPFFEVQTTYLNDWQKEVVGNEYFTLSNDTVTTSDAIGPTHSRGKIEDLPIEGNDMVHVFANRDVTGLTSSDPINDFTGQLPDDGIWPPGDIEVRTGSDLSPPNGRVIKGTLSSEVGGLKAANVLITATESVCSYVTTTGEFTCFIPDTAISPTLTVSGFDKPPKEIHLCSKHQFGSPEAELPVDSYTQFGDPKDVDLSNAKEVPVDPASPYQLWLTEEACPIEPEPCEGFCG